MSARILFASIQYRNGLWSDNVLEKIVGFEDIADDSGFTHLHQLVCGLSSGCLRTELGNYGELIDVQDNYGWSPLFWAISLHDYESTRVLLEHGADSLAIDASGSNVLHRSCHDLDMLLLLMDFWSTLPEAVFIRLGNQKDKYMTTPWQLTTEGDTLSVFLTPECDLSERGMAGRTALHLAMDDRRAASWAKALMFPGIAVVDLAAKNVWGDSAHDDYNQYYPTDEAKTSPEGKVRWALLMYAEWLKTGGEGPRIWEEEEDSHDGSDGGGEVFEDALDHL